MLCCIFHTGPVCAPQNVLNFTMSSTTTLLVDTACLACLFDGVSSQPGTTWSVNGLVIDGSQDFAQVNDNGTVIIRRPAGFIGQVSFLCERMGITFNITINGELHVVALPCYFTVLHCTTSILNALLARCMLLILSQPCIQISEHWIEKCNHK